MQTMLPRFKLHKQAKKREMPRRSQYQLCDKGWRHPLLPAHASSLLLVAATPWAMAASPLPLCCDSSTCSCF